MAGWPFTSVHHSEHSRNRHSPKWWMFMREYNSWRALCPSLAADALTPIWMYLNCIQVPVPIYANDMCHQCSVSVSPKWPAASRSKSNRAHGSPRAWPPLSWWWCAKAWPHGGHHHQNPKTYMTIVFNSAEACILCILFKLCTCCFNSGICDMGCRTRALRMKIWQKLLEKLMQKRKKKLVAHLIFQILIKMLEITFPWIQITIFNNSSSKNSWAICTSLQKAWLFIKFIQW